MEPYQWRIFAWVKNDPFTAIERICDKGEKSAFNRISDRVGPKLDKYAEDWSNFEL